MPARSFGSAPSYNGITDFTVGTTRSWSGFTCVPRAHACPCNAFLKPLTGRTCAGSTRTHLQQYTVLPENQRAGNRWRRAGEYDTPAFACSLYIRLDEYVESAANIIGFNETIDIHTLMDTTPTARRIRRRTPASTTVHARPSISERASVAPQFFATATFRSSQRTLRWSAASAVKETSRRS